MDLWRALYSTISHKLKLGSGYPVVIGTSPSLRALTIITTSILGSRLGTLLKYSQHDKIHNSWSRLWSVLRLASSQSLAYSSSRVLTPAFPFDLHQDRILYQSDNPYANLRKSQRPGDP